MTIELPENKQHIHYYSARTFRHTMLREYNDDPEIVRHFVNLETQDGRIDFEKLKKAYQNAKKECSMIPEFTFRDDEIIEYRL